MKSVPYMGRILLTGLAGENGITPYVGHVLTNENKGYRNVLHAKIENEPTRIIINADVGFTPYTAILPDNKAGIAVASDGIHTEELMKAAKTFKHYDKAIAIALPDEVPIGTGSKRKNKIGAILNNEGRGGLGVINKYGINAVEIDLSRENTFFVASNYHGYPDPSNVYAVDRETCVVPNAVEYLTGKDETELAGNARDYFSDRLKDNFVNLSLFLWNQKKGMWMPSSITKDD